MGWEQLRPWLELRRELPVGPLLCVVSGTTRGRHWSPDAARAELRRSAAAALIAAERSLLVAKGTRALAVGSVTA